MLLQIGLYFHILAILLVGAGGIGGAIVEHQLWKKIKLNSAEARSFIPILQTTVKFIKIGIVVFLLSGLIMLYSVQWAYLNQPWFIIKFILFLSLPLRAAIIARPAFAYIDSEILKENKNLPVLLKVKLRMNRFHIIQYSIVLIIIFLGIFK